MQIRTPPVTAEHLRIFLLEHLENQSVAPVPVTDEVGTIAEDLIAAASNHAEIDFGNIVLMASKIRRHPIRRDATRLLMRLAAECELEAEGAPR